MPRMQKLDARALIEALEGPTKVAAVLLKHGKEPITTSGVSWWCSRGSIPGHRLLDIIDAFAKEGVVIDAATFRIQPFVREAA